MEKIKYQGDTSAPLAHLENSKLLFNGILSKNNAKFMTLDMSNFYLMTPMKDYRYLQINLSTTLEEIIKELNLHNISHNGWVHTGIRKGADGLPQTGMLANELLEKRLAKAGYYKLVTLLGLW